ncbi:hypothetical protein DJ568_00630 [Mucilaginibacter hurinus]|uniref:Uncharacterized protein n=1 Tax=Mucilaginibacter hurinus TaxID=2201324 RepID=A0A367GT92_9SPHI|nr:hypothetical protein [Mucilaginibacter hurinus]RCH56398.1 hypothetical protein DJ568_00630 [Mucilaginibacter hurinus]
MKRLLPFLLMNILCLQLSAQVKDTLLKPIPSQLESLSNDTLLTRHNLSQIWLQTKNADVLGFIGADYQRIHIKFIEVKKSQTAHDIYQVYGKSMVKNNVAEFRGKLTVTQIFKKANSPRGLARYVLTGDYEFAEDKNLPHAGIFRGFFVTKIYVDAAGKAHYDDLEKAHSDYANNQFSGDWLNYDNIQVQRCNWGDYRIAGAGELDSGTANFFPYARYADKGWQNFVEAAQEGLKGDQAKKEEIREWWK